VLVGVPQLVHVGDPPYVRLSHCYWCEGMPTLSASLRRRVEELGIRKCVETVRHKAERSNQLTSYFKRVMQR
jgi:hypothetical protein